ncbi:hypothetical protein Acy02nite_91080 [Actinoplanes cyaneus]|uniref:Uncharacterized protein n=2 Tax=Actinoplanes cyaneus TaxID=52696 RepID=A0A919M9V1_9ACTN|nr:hypothetical protein Acy02nite_91080 [Actinoplanes cyaneus]
MADIWHALPMSYRLTGVSAFNFGAEWERVPGDEDVASRVMIFLADRRLLFGDRHHEDELECVGSAQEIRRFLTQEISAAKPGKSLSQRLSLLREAARSFVDRAGPRAREFHHDSLRFGLALGDLRTAFALHLAAIAEEFDLELEYELARLVFPEGSEAPESDEL